MGGKRQQSNEYPVARGISVRELDSSKCIRIDFTYRGVRCRETLKIEPTKANIKYAERLRGEILNAISLGTFNYQDYFPNSQRSKMFGYSVMKSTVGELLNEYMEIAEKTLEPSTFNGYRKACEAHLYPAFGNIPIKDLSSMIIRNYVTKLELTLKTIRNILTPLRNTLDQALNDGMITSNPLDRLVLSKLVDKKTRSSNWEVDPFNQEEIKAILSEAKDQSRNLFQFAFYSGLRTSELIALEWGDIDWLNGIVRVSRAVVLKKEKGTKTKSGQRDVLLLPPALEALQNQKKFTFLEGTRVFYNPRTNTAWETDGQIRKTCWTHILKKAGVRYRNPYQTRHTYASMMLSAGENSLWVAKQMGHKDTEMIIKNYGRWIPDTSTLAGYTTVNDWSSPLTGQVKK
ncbi:site-specific integrase [Legionella parisiensis]|uniref:Transposase from transposon Tn916 n=1 Tax=Legionella parisiensis TaxID=45071 RepID=A0A1E5JSJ7_9GAMM|nr:site-specific integrase [Legionella parisiensis]KTD43015.1 putative lambdoid prophage Rac integrase [Legionella parisiensis]OEH47509.1 Transposase from transposon Tn916 [Legionella parisiensis]STX77911.1 putative lambdoid prophage Rac integrase [Legionella parisiensis]